MTPLLFCCWVRIIKHCKIATVSTIYVALCLVSNPDTEQQMFIMSYTFGLLLFLFFEVGIRLLFACQAGLIYPASLPRKTLKCFHQSLFFFSGWCSWACMRYLRVPVIYHGASISTLLINDKTRAPGVVSRCVYVHVCTCYQTCICKQKLQRLRGGRFIMDWDIRWL